MAVQSCTGSCGIWRASMVRKYAFDEEDSRHVRIGLAGWTRGILGVEDSAFKPRSKKRVCGYLGERLGPKWTLDPPKPVSKWGPNPIQRSQYLRKLISLLVRLHT